VIKASKAANVFILDNVRPETVTRQIDDGIMICAGGYPEAAEIGRAYTKRTCRGTNQRPAPPRN